MFRRISFYMPAYCLFALSMTIQANAQGKKPSVAEIQSLDLKAEKAQQNFLKSMVDLATSYEKAGDVERSKDMLRSILKLKPDAESVKNKLKQYEEEVFDRKSTVVDLDVSRGWINAGVLVSKGKVVRIEADGKYRLLINTELSPQGYLQKDKTKDLVAGVPTGALIGMIAPATRKRNQPEPQPFMIGDKKELQPNASGILFLKVNTPPQAKCTGKLKVILSGNISR